MEKLRIGIIGCGGIANGKHMPSLALIKEVEMVAFCDIVEEKAVAAKAKYGNENSKTYTDYKELLADKSIDVVHVCTPNRSHSFITVDALEAGKHVMCEKPMAINSEEAAKMLDAAKRTGKKLTIGYQSRFRTNSQFMKMEAEKGTFGEIYYAKAHAIRRRAVPTWGVFLNEYEQGGGPLIDIGTHALDLTLWMMDNYKPKYCIGQAYHKLNDQTNQGNAWGNWDPEKFTVEDSAFGYIVMENGASIVLESSWALNILNPQEAKTTICGTLGGADMMGEHGGIRINNIVNNYQNVSTPDLKAVSGAAYFEGAGSGKPEEIEAYQWIQSIINDTEPLVKPEQAYIVTRILEGIYTSSKTGDIYRF